MNLPFFLFRAVLYFGIWIGVATLMRRWSLAQDAGGGVETKQKMRKLGAGGLPFVALAITFAAFDWQMSLSAFLFSTIFGVYWFAGSLVAAIAALILAAAAASQVEPLKSAVNPNHVHSLGKYLFAFTAFWAYIAFSQYLLIWIANLPEEVPWYLVRTDSGWKGVGIFLALFQFVLPFLILMPRERKRTWRPLVVMSLWILAVHYVDIYWVVMPGLSPSGPRPSWMDLTAFLGVGGVCVAWVVTACAATPSFRPATRTWPSPSTTSPINERPEPSRNPGRARSHRHPAHPGGGRRLADLLLRGQLVHHPLRLRAPRAPRCSPTGRPRRPPRSAGTRSASSSSASSAWRSSRPSGAQRQVERLTTWGWVDRKAGVVHVPIGDAMARVVRGERP